MKKPIDWRSLELNLKLVHRCSACGISSNTYFCLLYNPCLHSLNRIPFSERFYFHTLVRTPRSCRKWFIDVMGAELVACQLDL